MTQQLTPEMQEFIALAFQAQRPLAVFGAALQDASPGRVRLVMPIRPEATTATGAVVGGVVAMLADVAAGLAVISAQEAPRALTTVEFTSQQIAPAIGDTLIAVGQVEKLGRQLSFGSADAFVLKDGVEKRVARLSAVFLMA